MSTNEDRIGGVDGCDWTNGGGGGVAIEIGDDGDNAEVGSVRWWINEPISDFDGSFDVGFDSEAIVGTGEINGVLDETSG